MTDNELTLKYIYIISYNQEYPGKKHFSHKMEV